MYTIQIYNTISKISPKLPEDIAQVIYNTLCFKVDGSLFSKKFQNGVWDGYIRFYKRVRQEFYTGHLSRLRNILLEYSIPFQIIDCRTKPELGQSYNFTLSLRPYQEDIFKVMLKSGRGIIKSATGSGKSVSIGKFIAEVNVPTLIVVPRKSLLYQLQNDLSSWLGIPIGILGDGECDPRRITVATIQSITSAFPSKKKGSKEGSIKTPEQERRYEIIRQVVKNIECLIIDECQHMVSTSLQFLESNATSAYYRFGFSATPFFSDELQLSVEKYTGKVIIDISASKLIKEGFLAKPTILLSTYRHSGTPIDPQTGKPFTKFQDIYDKAIVYNDSRNNQIVKYAIEQASKNKSTLIAVSRKDHGTVLLEKLSPILGNKVKYVNGDDDSEELTITLKELNTKTKLVVIATIVFSEGVNCPGLDTLIIAKAQESRVDTLQLVGRVLRKTKDKTNVLVIDIQDKNCKYLTSHSNSRVKAYKIEDEFILTDTLS